MLRRRRRRQGQLEEHCRCWSISDDSLRRYVEFASASCIQELLTASDVCASDPWKVIAVDDHGVEISKRLDSSGAVPVFRSRRLLTSISPQQFMLVANAIEAARQWDSDIVETSHLKDLSENISIIRLRYGDSAKSLLKNREFIVYQRKEIMSDGTAVVAVASLPKEISAGFLSVNYKKRRNINGLQLLQSGWVVEGMDGNESCMVTYVVQLDPSGWMPKCFVNRLNTKMIIDNLKKIAQAWPINTIQL